MHFFKTFLTPLSMPLSSEHIAISKSFGRVNNYTIRPSQELIAIGVTNLIGPFFGELLLPFLLNSLQHDVVTYLRTFC